MADRQAAALAAPSRAYLCRGRAFSCRGAMSSYTGPADRPDRAKAIAAVIAVHAALAAIILAGLNVRMVTAAVEQMKTFDVSEPPPPPRKPPPQQPAPKPQQARKAAGEP